MQDNNLSLINQFSFFKQGIYEIEEKTTQEYELLLRHEVNGKFIFPENLFYKLVENRKEHKRYIKHISQLLERYFSQSQDIYWLNLEYQELYYEETLDFLKNFKYKKRLKIELTERIPIMRDNPYGELIPVQVIKEIKEMGYSIALDDFLSGINTFETLYAINELICRVKISLVSLKKVLPEEEANNLVLFVANIISGLGKEVVIEGVEDSKMILLFSKNWKQQSYYYSIPQNVEENAELKDKKISEIYRSSYGNELE